MRTLDDLSVRIRRCLLSGGIDSLAALKQAPRGYIQSLPGIGSTSLAEIEQLLGAAIPYHPEETYPRVVTVPRWECRYGHNHETHGEAAGCATPLEAMHELSTPVRARLQIHGVKTVGQLRLLNDAQLLALPGFGRKMLNEVREVLAAGLTSQ